MLPHDKGRLKAQSAPVAQPPVARVVVLGRQGQSCPLVETAEVEHRFSVERHIGRIKYTARDPTGVLDRLIPVDRRRDIGGIGGSEDPAGHNTVRLRFEEPDRLADPIGNHGAVVVGDENGPVAGRPHAVIGSPGDPSTVTRHDPHEVCPT